jgi:LysR family tcuABC transcriptional regulator
MDIRQLRYFAYIVETGSFSKAARTLFVAQPALSQQIAKLEDEVGMPLLVRSPRGVTPTGNGAALYHHARFMLRQFDQSISIARQGASEIHGMVSVGLPATTVAALGLALVRGLRKSHPGILLNVVEGMSGHLSTMMNAGQLDLVVLFSMDMPPEFTCEPLLDEELFVIFPARNGLVDEDRNTLTLAEAARLPLILPTGTHGLRRRISAEFEARGLTAHVVAEIDSLGLLMECVHEGIGATIKPMSALHIVKDRQSWRAIPISDARLSRWNYLYSAAAHQLSPAAVIVASLLRDTARRLVRMQHWKGVTLPDAAESVFDSSQA